MAFLTAQMPRPQTANRPSMPVVPIDRIRPEPKPVAPKIEEDSKSRALAKKRGGWKPTVVAAPDPSDLEKLLSKFKQAHVSQPAPVDPAEAIDSSRVRIAKQLVAMIARKHGVTFDDIMHEKRRFAPVVAARHEAIVLVCQNLPSWSLPHVGRFFGKDHTTIIHALRKAGVPSSRANRSNKKTAP